SSPTPGTGLDIIGPIQTTIRHATFAGLVIGIYIDQGDKFLAPQVVLEEVNLARNGVGLLYQQSQSLLVIRSIIEENLLGLSGGSSILLYNSVVRKNQLAGLVLNMLSAPGPRSLGQINNNEFLQNGIGIYLETGILLPLAEASWIEINQNHINQNLQYAIVVRDPSCPSVSGQSPSSQAVHSGQINFFGSQNEIQNNGKGNLCPSDYRLPPGFVKP
ncbi:right-handed parallel beta-helix repeat-containing protein, partial [Candidatus Acetothermia bacterium]|nr:right-handed parallel beta-helix repeat-containing protein [Candidatus Acetothermia bacterium]